MIKHFSLLSLSLALALSLSDSFSQKLIIVKYRKNDFEAHNDIVLPTEHNNILKWQINVNGVLSSYKLKECLLLAQLSQ